MSAAPRSLLVVWHSFTGATAAMVDALVQGAHAGAGDAVRVIALRAADAGADEVLAANAVVFATPETLAALSGAM